MVKFSNTFSSFAVDDLKKARDFYENILGLKVSDHPMNLLEIFTDGNAPIIVYPKPDHIPATFTILNFGVSNIEEAVDELTRKGVVFEKYSGSINTDEKGISRSEGGPDIAWFRDPAGNIFSILEES